MQKPSPAENAVQQRHAETLAQLGDQRGRDAEQDQGDEEPWALLFETVGFFDLYEQNERRDHRRGDQDRVEGNHFRFLFSLLYVDWSQHTILCVSNQGKR